MILILKFDSARALSLRSFLKAWIRQKRSVSCKIISKAKQIERVNERLGTHRE